MREIKFRADDGMGWIYSSAVEYREEDNQWLIFDFEQEKWMYCSEPEQYTGLKDENGSEIYEGDIIKKTNAFWLDGLLGQTEFKNGSFKLVVNHRWAISSYHFTEYDAHNDMGSSSDLKNTYEVIGNIHENPELLAGGSD